MSFLSVNFQLFSEGHKSVLITVETTCPTQIDGKEEANVEEDDLKDADDADLAELGFTKLDTKRLRSYLAN